MKIITNDNQVINIRLRPMQSVDGANGFAAIARSGSQHAAVIGPAKKEAFFSLLEVLYTKINQS